MEKDIGSYDALPQSPALRSQAGNESERFTPGPWEIYRQPISGADEAKAELAFQVDNTSPIGDTLFLISAGGKCPAETGCGPTSEANAHLVCAAPEMFKALKVTDEKLTKLIYDLENRVDAKSIALLVAWQDDVRAALAKALGATP